jgi:putative tricarboxylic transport membrane protein
VELRLRETKRVDSVRRADQITGVVVLIFSIILMEESWRMPQSATFGPGVGFLPFWLGVLMAVLSIVLMIKARRGPGDPGEKRIFPGWKALVTLAGVLAGLAVYILLLDVLGFFVDTALYSAFLLGAVERERWPKAFVVAVLNSGGLYVIFRILLGVNLPKNMFGF